VTFLSARPGKQGRGETAAERLARETGADVRFLPLDVTDEGSVRRAAAAVAAEGGRLDVLVNNAGVLLDEGGRVATLDAPTLRATLETNALGALRVTQAFLPLLRRSPHPRVVNVSSTAGSITDMAAAEGWRAPAYRVSKAALNAVTALFASELRAERILVNACCPGWLRTDMGGPSASRSAAEGADTPLWLATLPDDGPTGGFFSERRPHPW
jgi:NAD(P)-dependent dehydrogenase (short-subunit alcohol dehydrogenase family)